MLPNNHSLSDKVKQGRGHLGSQKTSKAQSQGFATPEGFLVYMDWDKIGFADFPRGWIAI